MANIIQQIPFQLENIIQLIPENQNKLELTLTEKNMIPKGQLNQQKDG